MERRNAQSIVRKVWIGIVCKDTWSRHIEDGLLVGAVAVIQGDRCIVDRIDRYRERLGLRTIDVRQSARSVVRGDHRNDCNTRCVRSRGKSQHTVGIDRRLRGKQSRTVGGCRDRDGLVRLVEGRRRVAVHSFGRNDIGKDDAGKGTGVFVDGKVPGGVESWWIVDRCDRQGEGSRWGAVVVRRRSRWTTIDGDNHDAHRTVGIFGQGEAQLTGRVDCRTDCEHRIVAGRDFEGNALGVRAGVFIGRCRWACQDVCGPRSQVRSGILEDRQAATCGELRRIVDRSDAHGDRPSGALLTRLVSRIVGNDVADKVLADEVQWWNVIESNDATVAKDRQDNTTSGGKLFDIGHTNGLAFGDLIGRTRQIVR